MPILKKGTVLQKQAARAVLFSVPSHPLSGDVLAAAGADERVLAAEDAASKAAKTVSKHRSQYRAIMSY